MVKFRNLFDKRSIYAQKKVTILNNTTQGGKKMNKENKKGTKKLPGFYIALCCCVLVIGAAGYFAEMKNSTTDVLNKSEVSENVSESINDETAQSSEVFSADTENQESTVSLEQTPVPAEETNTLPVVSQPLENEETASDAAPVEDYAVDNPDVQESAIIVSSQQPVFIMPVMGEIIGEYSDKLLYNNTLSDWRTHNGVDIKSETGCSVQAAADGVIENVSEDVMGNYVEISHAAGFVTRYMGLETLESLTVGKEIKSGEVIGTTGTPKGENVTEPHLHFEMMKDGSYVNPKDYLPH